MEDEGHDAESCGEVSVDEGDGVGCGLEGCWRKLEVELIGGGPHQQILLWEAAEGGTGAVLESEAPDLLDGFRTQRLLLAASFRRIASPRASARR